MITKGDLLGFIFSVTVLRFMALDAARHADREMIVGVLAAILSLGLLIVRAGQFHAAATPKSVRMTASFAGNPQNASIEPLADELAVPAQPPAAAKAPKKTNFLFDLLLKHRATHLGLRAIASGLLDEAKRNGLTRLPSQPRQNLARMNRELGKLEMELKVLDAWMRELMEDPRETELRHLEYLLEHPETKARNRRNQRAWSALPLGRRASS